MNFVDMVIKLQLIYKGKIILISCGSFYIAVGADAVTLNKKLRLKLNCIKRRICKVGVPKNAINKYIGLLNNLGYSYIIFDYNKDTNEIIKKHEENGKNRDICVYDKNCCNNCEKNVNHEKSEYEKALFNYVKEEFGEEFIW